MLADRVGDVFSFLVDPKHMVESALIALAVSYLLSRQLFRAILLAISFPGLIAFISMFLSLELLYSPVFVRYPPAIFLPLLVSLGFPSLLSGAIISTKCIFGLLTNKPDYRPNKIYIFMIVLQCALSAMTVYMTHFNDSIG